MVSVCLACFNGEKFIYEQILSILNQINLTDEIIISDDGSNDRTLDILNSFGDTRLKVFNHKSSGRPTENFENALNNAKGDIIFLSDQDDIWLEGKYTKMLALLTQYNLVLSDSILVDDQLNTIESSFFKYHNSKKGVIRNAVKNSYFGSCMAFRSELLNFALPFPRSKEIGHDVWLGVVAEMVGSVHFTSEKLLLYRRHENAVTAHGIGKSQRNLFIKLWSRVIMLNHIGVFYIKYLIRNKWKKD